MVVTATSFAAVEPSSPPAAEGTPAAGGQPAVKPLGPATVDFKQAKTESDEHVGVVRKVSADILAKSEEATNNKDAVYKTCIDQRSATMKGITRAAEDSFASVQQGAANKDGAAVLAAMGTLKAARGQAEKLRQEAESCVPGGGGGKQTQTEVTEAEGLTKADPTDRSQVGTSSGGANTTGGAASPTN